MNSMYATITAADVSIGDTVIFDSTLHGMVAGTVTDKTEQGAGGGYGGIGQKIVTLTVFNSQRRVEARLSPIHSVSRRIAFQTRMPV